MKREEGERTGSRAKIKVLGDSAALRSLAFHFKYNLRFPFRQAFSQKSVDRRGGRFGGFETSEGRRFVAVFKTRKKRSWSALNGVGVRKRRGGFEQIGKFDADFDGAKRNIKYFFIFKTGKRIKRSRRLKRSARLRKIGKTGENGRNLRRREIFLIKKGDYREKNEKNSCRALDKGGGRWYNGNRRVPVSVAKRRL